MEFDNNKIELFLNFDYTKLILNLFKEYIYN